MALTPLSPDIPESRAELAQELRRLFLTLDVSLRRWAEQQTRDPGAVSRYLSGRRPVQKSFVEDLIASAGTPPRAPLDEAAVAHVWGLFDKDVVTRLASTHSTRELQRAHERILDLERRLAVAEGRPVPAPLPRQVADATGTTSIVAVPTRSIAGLSERDAVDGPPQGPGCAPGTPPMLGPDPAATVDSPVEIPSAAWYAASDSRCWYSAAYVRRMVERGGIREDFASEIETMATRVVERLANPSAPVAYAARGLVVAPLQSGRTARVAAIAGRALDAGYRLIIVLAGHANWERQQLQEYLDKNLLGRENVAPDGVVPADYAEDPAWHMAEGFAVHGARPSRLGAFDIIRVTSRTSDYGRRSSDAQAFAFSKQDPALPFHHPQNLQSAPARLLVVKKNKAVLTRLIDDLRAADESLLEVPALVIDLAPEALPSTAIHTRREAGSGHTGLATLTRCVEGLLALLPRAQYVAWTTDPSVDRLFHLARIPATFPKDFVVSVPRPAGHLGIDDLYVAGGIRAAERTYANSPRMAHVRELDVHDAADDSEERRALDMFVLTGAVRLYRAAADGRDAFAVGQDHHVMMVHTAPRVADLHATSDRLRQLWHQDAENADESIARLWSLYETDVAPVSRARAHSRAVPNTFSDLIPFIRAARARLDRGSGPVPPWEGPHGQDRTSGDGKPVWTVVVVGGRPVDAELAEAATVRYYSPRVRIASLLYTGAALITRHHDLVRLYVCRPQDAAGQRPDLLAAMATAHRSSREIFALLTQSAFTPKGGPPITPDQLPSLIAELRERQSLGAEIGPVPEHRRGHNSLPGRGSANFDG
ncbi:hypothetical protein OG216_35410 [Streptomycetaceae bacterium NBC_01309]